MTARCSLTLLLAFSISGFASGLPPSARPVILTRLHADKIVGVDELRRRTIDDHDYLGFAGSFTISWGSESIYHPLVVLRKRHSDHGWSKAEVFSCRHSIGELFQLPERKFIRDLSPW